MKTLKLDNQVLQRVKDKALTEWKHTTLRHVDPDLYVCYCYCKAIEAECVRQGVKFELDLPPRLIPEPDDE